MQNLECGSLLPLFLREASFALKGASKLAHSKDRRLEQQQFQCYMPLASGERLHIICAILFVCKEGLWAEM
jgi:hypothetical protein